MRARNMQALTDQLKRRHPGIVIGGIGDAAHRLSPSDHNEDDTPGSRPEQTDADSVPEHRAIDLMIGKSFTVADAWAHVNAMVTLPENQRRLKYVIFMGWIWRRNGGWVRERYTGSDPHENHVHDSGWAPDDENGAPWILDVPTKIASTHRRKSMSTLYYSEGGEWALAGDSPGTAANWLTTRDQGRANAWAAAHGDAVRLDVAEYAAYRARYLSPLDVAVGHVEGGAL